MARRFLALLVGVGLVAAGCRRADDGAPAAGQRIVTLSPSATEVVAALGAADELVGVDDYSAFPPSVTALPRVGSYLAPNVEVIVGMRPTIVVLDDIHGAVGTTLAGVGVKTVVCPMQTLPDVKQGLRLVGQAIGRGAAADALVGEIDRELDEAAAHKPAARPRVLVVIEHEAGGLSGLVAAGSGTWLDELLAVVGGANVLSASGVRYPKIGPEEILRLRPDVILDVTYSANGDVAPWLTLGDEVPAVKRRRVFVRAEPFLLSPSPRVKEAIAVLREVVGAD